MLRLLHISDLHFGRPYLSNVGEALQRIAPTLDANVTIISGDLTQRARREEFVAAKEFIARLPSMPQVIIPGNHDVPLYRGGRANPQPSCLYREIIGERWTMSWSFRGRHCVAELDLASPSHLEWSHTPRAA
jgi:predicted MPP superfamily phosphohydrolase